MLVKKELEKQKKSKKEKTLTFGPGCPASEKNREEKCKIDEMEQYTFLSLKCSLRDQRKRTQPRKEAAFNYSTEPSVGVLGLLGSWGC